MKITIHSVGTRLVFIWVAILKVVFSSSEQIKEYYYSFSWHTFGLYTSSDLKVVFSSPKTEKIFTLFSSESKRILTRLSFHKNDIRQFKSKNKNEQISVKAKVQ